MIFLINFYFFYFSMIIKFIAIFLFAVGAAVPATFFENGTKFNTTYTYCVNGKRNVTFSSVLKEEKIPKNLINATCGVCDEGFYAKYNNMTSQVECAICDGDTTNYGRNIVINKFDEEIVKKYTMSFNCRSDVIKENQCNNWMLKNYTMLSNQTDKIENKFNFEVYIEKTSMMTISYKKSKYAMLNVYINNINQTIDNSMSDTSVQLTIKEGHNTISIVHSTLLTGASSHVVIYSILFKNALFSSFSCDSFPSLQSMKLPQCEYDNICTNEQKCNESFFTHMKSVCNIKTNKITVTHKLLPYAKCKGQTTMDDTYEECGKCPKGQYQYKINDTSEECRYCDEGMFSDENGNCVKCDDVISKALYIYPSIGNKATFKTKIVKMFGNIVIHSNIIDNTKNYFDLYVSINSTFINRTERYVNKTKIEIQLPKGKYEIDIKGSNVKMSNITIMNSNMGGGYRCDLPKREIELARCNTKDNFYYSFSSHRCLQCPSFSYAAYDTSHRTPLSFCALHNKVYSSIYYSYVINFASFLNGVNVQEGIIINKDEHDIQIKFINKTYVYDIKDKIYYGKELSNVNLVRAGHKRGLLLTYERGDRCNGDELYKTFVFIQCDKDSFVYQIDKVEIDNCEMYVIIKTINACPICTKSEVSALAEGECNNNIKNEYYKENDMCVIAEVNDTAIHESFQQEIIGINNKTSPQTAKLYKHFSMLESYYQHETYNHPIYRPYEAIQCFESNKANSILFIFLVIGIFFFLITVIIGIVLCCYIRHVNVPSYEKVPQHIEIPSINEANPDVNIF